MSKKKRSTTGDAPVEASRARREVLIVDDRADMREMYAEYLTFRGYEVSEASNGEEAIARCKVRLPAVVLMDLSMPVMDGWEATKRLKSDPRTSAVPVIVVTGHAMGTR